MADLILSHRTIDDTIQELQFQIRLYKFVNYQTHISELHPLYNDKISYRKYIESFDLNWSSSVLSVIVNGEHYPLFPGLKWLSSCGRYACYNPVSFGIIGHGQWLLYDNMSSNFITPYFKTKSNDYEKDCWHDLDAISQEHLLVQGRGSEYGYEPFEWYLFIIDKNFNMYLNPVNSEEFEILDDYGSALRMPNGATIESSKLIHHFPLEIIGQANNIFSENLLEVFQNNIEEVAVCSFFEKYPLDATYDENVWIQRYRDFLELIKDLQIIADRETLEGDRDEDFPF